MDVLDCYFGALGDGQVLLTGAKLCFQVPAVVFMPIGWPREAEGAWQGAPMGGSDPASPNVRHTNGCMSNGEPCARWRHQESEEMLKS